MTFAIGDHVRVTTGRFVDFVGVVNKIDPEKSKVRVIVSHFGRETPLELDFPQVAKL